MAGVHRGEQVETLRAADFAQDDAVGAHAQGVLDEVADGDRALALQVRRAGFQRQPVRLLQAKLRRVLDGQHALAGRSEEHTSELQSLMRNSYAVFCLKKKIQ